MSGSNCLSDSNSNDAIYLGHSLWRQRKRAGLNAILECGIFFGYAVGICFGIVIAVMMRLKLKFYKRET